MKKQHVRTWRYHAVLAVLASCGLRTLASAGHEHKDAPKPLPPAIVKVWRDAGAVVGWMKDQPPQTGVYRFWEPWREKGVAGALPAFRFPERNAGGVLAKFPDPGTAFGLDFHCGYYAGVTLKELAKLKNLQSLCIGGVQGKAYADLKDLAGMTNLRGLYLFYLPVTDAQLKHLAGLKNLQVLDLSHTQVTDTGMKELAGVKCLQWLNLRSTEVTPAGVAALQKQLPKCKIVTGDK
jgi:internalin A